MRRILVTGMSGTGKSTVLAELARRGHRVVDTDDDDWSVDVPLPALDEVVDAVETLARPDPPVPG